MCKHMRLSNIFYDTGSENSVRPSSHKPNDTLVLAHLQKIALPMLWLQVLNLTDAGKNVQVTTQPYLLDEQVATRHTNVSSGEVPNGPARLLRYAVNWKVSVWLAAGKKFWRVSRKCDLNVLEMLQLLTVASSNHCPCPSFSHALFGRL